LLVAAAGWLFRGASLPASNTRQLEQLSAEVAELKQEQAMAALVLSRHRESICYIFGVYRFRWLGEGARGHRPAAKRFSGTGFVAGPGLVATNRHVVEPWFDDAEAQALIRRGARPKLERLTAFFPGLRGGIELGDVTVSQEADIAVARLAAPGGAGRQALPLATAAGVPGEPVVVVGYPMGITAMVAKSPRPVYRRLAFRRPDLETARELASFSLIRPSATQGHLGDVIGDKLVYDAVTADGGSGGPVFNSHGQVIAINAAYLDGFSGGTLGVSVKALQPVLEDAKRKLTN